MEKTVLQVVELVSLVNQTLEYAYPRVVVEGEVSSFKLSKGKFVFFDLKDDEAAVPCFMMAYTLGVPLKDGMRIRMVAQPRLTAWGKFSLNVRTVMPVGEGSLKKAFDILKARLQAEGLFSAERKRRLPEFPARAAVIASVESAGYADFIKILNHRFGGLDIAVADVQVQGLGAAGQIIGAIEYFNQRSGDLPEVLVVVRGGGSADDLAVFNDERLVRAIAASRIPTLVGVGHETDTSLADLAADVRAATPSNAAQILVPDRHAILKTISQRQSHLASRVLRQIADTAQRVQNAPQQMLASLQNALAGQRRHLAGSRLALKQLDPKVVLNRGYAIARTEDGRLLRGKALGMKKGDRMTVTLEHAIIKAGVIDVQRQ